MVISPPGDASVTGDLFIFCESFEMTTCCAAFAALSLTETTQDSWSQILSWLETHEQVESGATCHLFRAAGANAIEGPAILRDAGFASFAKCVEARRIPRLKALVLDVAEDVDVDVKVESLTVRVRKTVPDVLSFAGPHIRSLDIQCHGDSPPPSPSSSRRSSMDSTSPDVDAFAVALIESCPNLERFRFDGVSKWETSDGDSVSLSDDTLALLARQTNLARLRLGACDGVTDAGLVEIARVRRLSHLEISLCTSVSTAGVEAIARNCRLKECLLRGLFEPIASDSVLSLVAGSSLVSLSLTTLSVVDDAIITDSALTFLAQQSPNLRNFDLFGGSSGTSPPQDDCKCVTTPTTTSGITTEGIVAVARHCRHIEKLRLGAHCDAPEIVSACVPWLPELRLLQADATAWTDRSIEDLTTHCPKISELTARNVVPGRVTERSLRSLATLPTLERLTLCPIHCESNASRAAAVLAVVRRPRLQHLDIGTTTPFGLFFCAANNIEYYDLPADPIDRKLFRLSLSRSNLA